LYAQRHALPKSHAANGRRGAVPESILAERNSCAASQHDIFETIDTACQGLRRCAGIALRRCDGITSVFPISGRLGVIDFKMPFRNFTLSPPAARAFTDNTIPTLR
jgi:hypothetical protein